MLDNPEVPFSDAWWLRNLSRKFQEQPKRLASSVADSRRCDYRRSDWLDMLWARLTGDSPFLRVNDKYAQATKEFMRLTRTNYAATVVSSVQDRTHFLGARTSGQGGNDADGDETVRGFMDANGSFFSDAMTYAYAMGSGAAIVAPPQDGEEYATATAEDPRQMVYSVDPVRPLKVRAALKMYRDEDFGEHVAHLYLSPTPGAVRGDADSFYRIRVARRAGNTWSGLRFAASDWEWDDSASGPLPLGLQDFGLPIVPVVNRWGMGEFESVLDVLDRVHNDIADRLWTQKYQTFLQRAAIGKFPPKDDKGNAIDYDSIFAADPGALWMMPEGATLWESKQVDLGSLISAVKADLLEISATTQTPMFAFTPDATGQSAEGADVAREGSVNKGRDRIGRFDPSAVRVTRLGLAYSGKPDVAKGEISTIWAPIREFTLQQRGSAAVQGKTAGMPFRSILSELWQFDPLTVARIERERDADLLYQDATAAAPVPPPGAPPAAPVPAPAVPAPVPAVPPAPPVTVTP